MKTISLLLCILALYLYAMFHGSVITLLFGQEFILIGWLMVALISTFLVILLNLNTKQEVKNGNNQC